MSENEILGSVSEDSVSPAAENDEELTGFDKILDENPQGYDKDAAKAFYDYQPTWWDDNTDEFWDGFEDSYQGEFDSDADFARELAEDLGEIPPELPWPIRCIDWEQAASELMYDYFEQDGYYFRNL